MDLRPPHIEKYALGNPHSYTNGCRCRDCTDAWAAYRRAKEHGPDGRRERALARNPELRDRLNAAQRERRKRKRAEREAGKS